VPCARFRQAGCPIADFWQAEIFNEINVERSLCPPLCRDPLVASLQKSAWADHEQMGRPPHSVQRGV
jgi:hypothetical protein